MDSCMGPSVREQMHFIVGDHTDNWLQDSLTRKKRMDAHGIERARKDAAAVARKKAKAAAPGTWYPNS